MRLAVVGCGYLGAVHAVAMATQGHEVVGFDIDLGRIERLARGEAPFHEPGFEPLLLEALASGRLAFTSEPATAAAAELVFIAVNTPQLPGSDAADLRYLESATDTLSPLLRAGTVVVGKSTVPVGTVRSLRDRLPADVLLAWNPEFLREGHAVDDTLRPDRLVYGLPDDAAEAALARAALDAAYAPQLAAGTPLISTDWETSELVKTSANAFLALKISFINAVAEVCAATGADVTTLADAIGLDERIGRRFLGAGLGFGGGCLPKDIRAFAARATELDADGIGGLLREADRINLGRRQHAVELTAAALGGDLAGTRVAVLGLAFKPDSDDIRDSPALQVAAELTRLGAQVRAHDPRAVASVRRAHPQLACVDRLEDAVAGADAVLVLTEWAEYRAMSPARLAELTPARFVLDARNCLDAEAWRAAGWRYSGLGRQEQTGAAEDAAA